MAAHFDTAALDTATHAQVIARAATEPAIYSPPVVVTGIHLLGFPIADWVSVFTGVYLVILLAHKLWSWRREVREHGRQHREAAR